MVNANEVLRDKALQATTDFLDSFDFDEETEDASNWEGSLGLGVAINACREWAKVEPRAKALYVTLLEMDYRVEDYGPAGPVYLKDGEVWFGMNPVSDVKRLVKELRDGFSSPARREQPMSYRQETLWDFLEGRCLSMKELASKEYLHTSEEVVRQLVLGLRQDGYLVRRRAGRGYWRPDEPPQEMMMTTPPT